MMFIETVSEYQDSVLFAFKNQSKVIHIQFFALLIAQIYGNWPNWTKIHKKSYDWF